MFLAIEANVGSPSWMEVQLFTAVFGGFIWRKRAYKRLASPRQYRNPLVVAQEWHALMTEGGLNQADLARKMRMSRARLTQMLRLLDLESKSAATVVTVGDPLPRQVITERALRPLIDLPVEEQKAKVAQLVRRAKEQLCLAAKKRAHLTSSQ